MTTITAPARHSRRSAPAVAPLAIARRAVQWLVNIALGVAMIASVVLAVFVGVEHIGFAPVLSPSMVPTFAPGDLVVTRQEPAADIRVGQVLVLPVPGEQGQRYVHRVIQVTYERGRPVVRTKGDANSAPESFRLRITSSTVPRVIHTVPKLGRLAVLLRGGTWRIAVMVLVAGLLLVSVKRALLDR